MHLILFCIFTEAKLMNLIWMLPFYGIISLVTIAKNDSLAMKIFKSVFIIALMLFADFITLLFEAFVGNVTFIYISSLIMVVLSIALLSIEIIILKTNKRDVSNPDLKRVCE